MRILPTIRQTVALIAVLALLTNSGRAMLVLDQELDAFARSDDPSEPLEGPNIDAGQFPLQTFTVGVGGTLDSIDVQVQHSFAGMPTSALVLTLRSTLPDGAPDRTQDLGSVSLPAGSISAFTDFRSGPFATFDVSGLSISVSAGDVLAFELSSATPDSIPYFVYDSQSDIYAGGSEYLFDPDDGAFFSVSRDLGFRTLVAIPEPSALLCVGFTAAAITCRRQRNELYPSIDAI
ncbi:MAG: hypothetical protein AAGD11_00560 [Planctomycetota bacterium]